MFRDGVGAGAGDDDVLTSQITDLSGPGTGQGNGRSDFRPKDLQDRTGTRPVVAGCETQFDALYMCTGI